jgi:hypothetical protein
MQQNRKLDFSGGGCHIPGLCTTEVSIGDLLAKSKNQKKKKNKAGAQSQGKKNPSERGFRGPFLISPLPPPGENFTPLGVLGPQG